MVDSRRLIDELSLRLGRNERPLRTTSFRHTYCSARLQTLDGGYPVALRTVVAEMGHGSTRMVDEIYAHVGRARHRADVVEYRVEQHVETLASDLEELRALR